MSQSIADMATDSSVAAPARDAAGEGSRFAAVRQVATVARSEYRLALRNRWAFALVGLFAVFGLMLVTFSGSEIGPAGAGQVIASLTNLSVYLVPLAALAFGYDAVVGRDRRGWLELVFSLPVSRARVVLGAFLGRAVVLVASTIIGFGAVGVVVLQEYGVQHWGAYSAFVGSAAAVGVAFLALGFLISALVSEKTHALGLALLAWVWFVLIHDLMALGAVATFELSETALAAFVLANPASIFRVLVLEQLGTGAGGGFAGAFAELQLSAAMMMVALMVWSVVAVAAAAVVVSRRKRWLAKLRAALKPLGLGAMVTLVVFGGAMGCFGNDDEQQEEVQVDPIAIEAEHSCSVCGMFVGEGEGEWGPNGQVFFRGDEDGPAIYDSVRELFIDMLARQRRGDEVDGAWVTDYASFDYQIETRRDEPYIDGSTDPDTFVELSEAVFVIDSGIRGAMGVELLPFSSQQAASDFVREHGGEMVYYDEIDLKMVESM